jgi:phage/plasmid-associated DNA primase
LYGEKGEYLMTPFFYNKIGTFQETDEGDKMNVGIMKEFTGGDKVLVRDLYKGSKEMIEFKPQMKYFLICN